MITNFDDKNKKRDDLLSLVGLALVVMFVVYLIIPPYNKTAQIGYVYNNIKYAMLKPEYKESIYLRNKAVYLAKMGSKAQAYKCINEAIALASGSATDVQLQNFYRDSANIKLYFSDYKGALNDYLKAGPADYNDSLKLAQLFKRAGKNKEALGYCNSIINSDNNAYSGYACLADLYATVGKYDISVKVYDLYLDKAGSKARGLADRAYYKRKVGDISGAIKDLEDARNISPKITEEITILEDAIKPKSLSLPII